MSFFKGASTTSKSTRIEAFQSSVCEFGTPVNMLYGTSKVSANVISYQDFTTKTKKTTVKSGKSKSTTITYLYYVYVELALGTPITSLGKIWVGDTKYDTLATLNSKTSNQGAGLSINIGNNSAPTAYMQTNHPDIAIGYSDLSYLYGKIFLGEDTASIPSYLFETKGALLSDGVDSNPADVIKDILTRIGLGDAVDETSFSNYVRYCEEADLLVSTPNDAFTSQKKASEVISELLEITNTYMVFSVNKFKFIPRDDQTHGDWSPNTNIIYDLTANDMIGQSSGGTISFKRKDTSEQYNYVTVNFTNRSNDYESESVSFQNVESVNTYGLKNISYDAKWYHTKARALAYAKMKARTIATEQTQYQFSLCSNYSRLEAGDLLRITDETIGLNRQVVMVSEVTESSDGIINVTAIQRADGNYSEALYTVDDDYNYQDFNVVPSDTAEPLFIIPPADLVASSSNGLEIWIAIHGKSSTWGGCDIYLSDKDSNYNYIGTQNTSSLYGTITSSMTSDSTSVSIKLNNVEAEELLSGSVEDAQAGNTLIWINGECMSYSLATLTAKNTWNLTGIVRGQYGTKAVAHNNGESMAVLDGSIYVVPLTKHYQGKTMYFKFPSFNVFKANNQSLNELDYYTCIANTADLPNCTPRAYNKYREMADDVTRYDIVVEWDVPDFDSYKQAQVWYKTSGIQASNLSVISSDTKASELGYSGSWIFGGYGYNTVTIPQAVIGDTYRIAVCTEDIYSNVESPDMSSQVDITVAMKTEIPNTPANPSVELGDSFVIKWDEVRNADVKYYEVRLDISVGLDNDNLLIRTTEHTLATNLITNRQGTIYIFAVSAYDKVSAPAILTYNYSTPSAPLIIVTSKLQGIECISSAIPNNCLGIHWFFDGTNKDEDIKTINKTYFYTTGAGVYEVSACFYDYFGDGIISGNIMTTIEAYIPAELLDAETFNYEKMSTATKQAIAEASTDNINVAVKGILGNGSALVLQEDGYALVTSNGTKLTGLFVDENGTIRLDGSYIHITGDTVIDGSIITNNMLAGGISADKISSGNIAISNNLTISNSKVIINANGVTFTGLGTKGNGRMRLTGDGIEYLTPSGASTKDYAIKWGPHSSW